MSFSAVLAVLRKQTPQTTAACVSVSAIRSTRASLNLSVESLREIMNFFNLSWLIRSVGCGLETKWIFRSFSLIDGARMRYFPPSIQFSDLH